MHHEFHIDGVDLHGSEACAPDLCNIHLLELSRVLAAFLSFRLEVHDNLEFQPVQSMALVFSVVTTRSTEVEMKATENATVAILEVDIESQAAVILGMVQVAAGLVVDIVNRVVVDLEEGTGNQVVISLEEGTGNQVAISLEEGTESQAVSILSKGIVNQAIAVLKEDIADLVTAVPG